LRIRARAGGSRAPDVKRAYYTLGDENHEIVFVACSKCEWKAAFERAELIAVHGRDSPIPDLLNRLAAPGCPRIGNQWDRCGAHYVNPIED
jgi:hypothetical protein